MCYVTVILLENIILIKVIIKNRKDVIKISHAHDPESAL